MIRRPREIIPMPSLRRWAYSSAMRSSGEPTAALLQYSTESILDPVGFLEHVRRGGKSRGRPQLRRQRGDPGLELLRERRGSLRILLQEIGLLPRVLAEVEQPLARPGGDQLPVSAPDGRVLRALPE